jgi:hypothetical protein
MSETREHVIARLKKRSRKTSKGCLKRLIVDWFNRELEIRDMPPLTKEEEKEI